MRTHCLGGSFFPGWLEYEIQQGVEIILGMDVNELITDKKEDIVL